MNQIIINTNKSETRIAQLEDSRLVELIVERATNLPILGNIYKGVVSRILPGMQSAFIDIGEDRSGFLFIDDVLDRTVAETASNNVTENSDDDIIELYKKHRKIRQPIEKILRQGECILVQVIKVPQNEKGARLSMFLTLPGRFLVLAPYFTHVGVSKKIETGTERNRLRNLLEGAKPPNISAIARTASQGVDSNEIGRELNYLCQEWSVVEGRFREAAAPSLARRDIDIVQRFLRDTYQDLIDEIIVDDKFAFEELYRFLSATMPKASYKIMHYKESLPIFDAYDVEDQINSALQRKVDLDSGGYIIIDQTEALTTIDVNSGSYVGKKNQQSTILKVNLEAAIRSAQEIRLRNIGGIIILDFIDMNNPTDRELVYNALNEALRRDRAKTTVLRVSELGLVQMTRKRTSESLQHALLDDCTRCHGLGRTKSVATLTHELLRDLVKSHIATGKRDFAVKVREDIKKHLLNEEHAWYQEVIEKNNLNIKLTPLDWPTEGEPFKIFQP